MNENLFAPFIIPTILGIPVITLIIILLLSISFKKIFYLTFGNKTIVYFYVFLYMCTYFSLYVYIYS